MTKSIYALAFALVVGTTGALASPGDDGCVGNCPQAGGGPTEITNENTNSNTALAGAIAGSNSDSNASAAGGDATVLVGVGVKTGATSSGSSSSAKGGDGGDAHASGGAGGDSSSSSAVGDTSSVSSASNGGNSTGDVGVSIADNSSYSIEYEQSAARAANVYAEVCMNGGSAQGVVGGFGVSNQDVVCEHLKVAAVMREAYIFEMKYGTYNKCEAVEEEVTCVNKKAQEYLDAYHENLEDALTAMEVAGPVGLMDKIGGFLVRPAALIGALIWLI